MKAGLKQTEMAEKLSVSDQCVSDWECGRYLPKREKINEMAVLFGVKPLTLMGEIYTADEKTSEANAPN